MPSPTRRRLALLILLAWSRRAAADTSAFTVDSLLARLAAVPERRAGFTERRRFAALDTILESRGTLALRGTRLEKITDWPQPERLEIDGDRIVITAANEPPRVLDIGMAPELRLLVDAIRGPLTGDAAALRRAFIASVTGTIESWTLDLAPRDPRHLRAVRLLGHGDQPETLIVTQANGDEQTMTISPR